MGTGAARRIPRQDRPVGRRLPTAPTSSRRRTYAGAGPDLDGPAGTVQPMTSPLTDADAARPERADEQAEAAIRIDGFDPRAIVRLPRADGADWETDLVRAVEIGDADARARLVTTLPDL